jgi:hypothetical protein
VQAKRVYLRAYMVQQIVVRNYAARCTCCYTSTVVAYQCGSSSRAIDRCTVQAVHPPAALTSGSAVGADDTGQRTAASTTSAANNASAVAAQSESASVTSSSSSGSVTAGSSGAMANQTACANVGCASSSASIGSSTTQVSSYTSCSLYW